MKSRIFFLVGLFILLFSNSGLTAFPVAIKPLENDEVGVKKAKSQIEDKEVLIKELSKRQQEKLNKKIEKLNKKLRKRGIKTQKSDDFRDVFTERYFILGSIFVLGGLALVITAAIVSLGVFGWLGVIGIIVGLVLVTLAIFQST